MASPTSKSGAAPASETAELDRARCPKCGSTDVRRSTQEGIKIMLRRVLGQWPFRCRSCRQLFFRSRARG
jgi:hypothetical protein